MPSEELCPRIDTGERERDRTDKRREWERSLVAISQVCPPSLDRHSNTQQGSDLPHLTSFLLQLLSILTAIAVDDVDDCG